MKNSSVFLESSPTYKGVVKQVSDVKGATEYPTLIEIEVDGAKKFVKPWLEERLPREASVEVVLVESNGYIDAIVYSK